MEALGAAASVAGILSLAGQSINGIVKLRTFIKDTKSASRTVDSFLSDVDSFEASLLHIQEILLQFSSDETALASEIGLETLKWQLEACWSDVQEWTTYAEPYKGRFSKGISSFFSQLRVAGNKDEFNEFHSRIARHQKGLAVSLSTLGRSLDIQGLQHMQGLSDQLSNFEEVAAHRNLLLTETIKTTLRAQETHHTTQQVTQTVVDSVEPLKAWMESSVASPLAEQTKTLERVETSTQLNLSYRQEEVSSIKALSDAVSSLGSQLAELQASISKPKPREVEEMFSCRTLIGIEEAFDFDDCIFCGTDLGECDWRTRGMHLVLAHSFGNCEAETHHTRISFISHLISYHDMTNDTIVAEFFAGQVDKIRRLPRELDYISKDYESYPDGHYEDPRLSFADDANSIDKEFLVLARSINDLALDTSVRRFAELQSATLTAFWDLDWNFNCLRERYYLQEKLCLLDLFYCTESEDQLRALDHIMSPLAKSFMYQTVSLYNAVKISESCRDLWPAFSFNEAFWVVFYLETAGCSRGYSRTEERILTAMVHKSSSILFKSKVKLYMEVYSRTVDWLCPTLVPTNLLVTPATEYAYTTVHAIIGRKGWKADFDATLAEIKTELLCITRGSWVQAEAWQAKINNWSLQALARSSVMRVIAAHVTGQVNPLEPFLLTWLLQILVEVSPSYDASFLHPKSLISQAAVDSRDDLKSLFQHRAGPLLIACSCCLEQPAFFRSRDDLEFHVNEKSKTVQVHEENSFKCVQVMSETHQTHKKWSCSGLLSNGDTKWVENVRLKRKAGGGWHCNYCQSYDQNAVDYYAHNDSKAVSHFRHDHHFSCCGDDVEFDNFDNFLLHLQDVHSMLIVEKRGLLFELFERQAKTTKSTKSTRRTTVDIVQTTTMKMTENEEVKIASERVEDQDLDQHEYKGTNEIEQEMILDHARNQHVKDLKSLVNAMSDQRDREVLNEIVAKASFLAGLLAQNE